MFISMGCDGNNVFQGARASVIASMKKNVVPFLMGVHYFAHWTNFIVLWKLTLVVCLEALLEVLYGVFFHLPETI